MGKSEKKVKVKVKGVERFKKKVFFLETCLKQLSWNDGEVIKLRDGADINVCLH